MKLQELETVIPSADVAYICKESNAISVTLEHWKPKTQEQLIKWLEKQHPSAKNFHLLNKSQRWAIYFRTIKDFSQC